MFRCIAITLSVLFLSISTAQAGPLFCMTAEGTTSSANLNIGPNIDYTVKAFFEGPPVSTSTGLAIYRALEIEAAFNGTTINNKNVGSTYLFLGDPTNTDTPGFYYVTLGLTSPGGEASLQNKTRFATATPDFDPMNPAATVFSDYASVAGRRVFAILENPTYDPIKDPRQFYVFDYEGSVGVSVSISVVPEPSTLALSCVAASILFVIVRRRDRGLHLIKNA